MINEFNIGISLIVIGLLVFSGRRFLSKEGKHSNKSFLADDTEASQIWNLLNRPDRAMPDGSTKRGKK